MKSEGLHRLVTLAWSKNNGNINIFQYSLVTQDKSMQLNDFECCLSIKKIHMIIERVVIYIYIIYMSSSWHHILAILPAV